MTKFRCFAYFGPRLSQIVGWTFDANSLTDPLLQDKGPKIPDRVYQIQMAVTSEVMRYVPPPYNHFTQFPKLKG
jgi:hypothetical protein